jgi:hypothetical protein
MLPEYIKYKISKKFGQPIKYPKDCIALAANISNDTGLTISGTTLKRLYGIINSDIKVRKSTLDIIAHYIGYPNWEEATKEATIHANNSYSESLVIIEDLKENARLQLIYNSAKYIVLQYLNNYLFQVVDVNMDIKIMKGDVLHIMRLKKNFPLICESISRNGKNLGVYISEDEFISVTFLA